MKCPECERLQVLAKVASPDKREGYRQELAGHQMRVHGVFVGDVPQAAGLFPGKAVKVVVEVKT